MTKSDINWKSMSDIALLNSLGEYIKHHRLEQNKTQSQLAKDAGINRSTLSEIEQGNRSNTLTLIQILRALHKLDVFDSFKIVEKISPIQLAKLEKNKRKRASKSKTDSEKMKSDW